MSEELKLFGKIPYEINNSKEYLGVFDIENMLEYHFKQDRNFPSKDDIQKVSANDKICYGIIVSVYKGCSYPKERVFSDFDHGLIDQFEFIIDFEESNEERQNIVKSTCKELGMTYKELGEAIGYGGDTLRNTASKKEVSEQITKAISLYLETIELKKQLEDCNILKQVLKNLTK